MRKWQGDEVRNVKEERGRRPSMGGVGCIIYLCGLTSVAQLGNNLNVKNMFVKRQVTHLFAFKLSYKIKVFKGNFY